MPLADALPRARLGFGLLFRLLFALPVAMPARKLPRQQLTVQEMERIDSLMRREHQTPREAWQTINADRAKV